jgi:transposase
MIGSARAILFARSMCSWMRWNSATSGSMASILQRPAGPAYHPSPMLKLYIYGYLNRVQSSRRLEREAGRNLEVMWLIGRLAPDHKPIADFRKDNGPAIRKVCARFVELCRKMGLLAKASVAIDGSKFKAVNSRDNNFTQGKIQRRQKQIEESVARYMSQLDTADRRTAAGWRKSSNHWQAAPCSANYNSQWLQGRHLADIGQCTPISG